jgi:hypothetical protein
MTIPKPSAIVATTVALLNLASCTNEAKLPVSATMGPNPQLVQPDESLIPTANIAPAIGWQASEAPIAAQNTQVAKFADELDHPRWLYVLPNGDVLVAETNAPKKPEGADDNGGIKQWFMKKLKQDAGAGVPSADRITLLRDRNADGVAEQQFTLLENLHSPFGMALVDDTLYVANTDALVKFPYREGQTSITDKPVKVIDLPAGPLNRHWTKNLLASPDGSKLYVAIGSNSNIAENGFDKEVGRAAIWELDIASGKRQIFAHGLRNPVGMTWVTPGNALWVAVNERDELGGDLVPDYMTSVEAGGFYGWPYSYYGQHLDERVQQRQPELVTNAIVPDYALGAHTASLGLVFSDGGTLPKNSAPGDEAVVPFGRGMFVGQHGSWNRDPLSGYRVIFVPFSGDKPNGKPIDVLTGFINERGEAKGRPVGVAIDKQGGLLVADDVGNTIWRVIHSNRNNNNDS